MNKMPPALARRVMRMRVEFKKKYDYLGRCEAAKKVELEKIMSHRNFLREAAARLEEHLILDGKMKPEDAGS